MALGGFPIHRSLSQASPNNPVVLTHASGHAAFANAKAMELAGVTRRTKNPSGGEVLKDKSGEPTGLFRETAEDLLDAAYRKARASLTAEEAEAETRRRIQLADEEALSKGVTSFQDAGSSFETIDVFKKVASEGKLGVRLWVMIRDTNERMAEKLASYRLMDGYDQHLTVRAIKHTLDGALGSRGAWLLEPYSDMPSSRGLETTPLATVEETAKLAMANGYQLCVHAIGDRANRETLNLFEAAFKANPDKKDVRWRIEHAQHINAADIPRFGQLGVIASMQGIHCTSDAVFVPARLGAARSEEGAYVWQSSAKRSGLCTVTCLTFVSWTRSARSNCESNVSSASIVKRGILARKSAILRMCSSARASTPDGAALAFGGSAAVWAAVGTVPARRSAPKTPTAIGRGTAMFDGRIIGAS